MKAVKKILVGVDSTAASLQALRRASGWGQAWDAKVEALHVLPELPYDGAGSSGALVDSMTQLESEVEQALEKKIEAMGLAQASLQLQVRIGTPYLDLLRESLAAQSDLIVLGSETKKGLAGLFLGDTGEAVVQKSLVPTWVERLGQEGEIKRILIPTDLSENSHSSIVAGLDWVRLFKATPILLHVAETPYIPTFSLIDPKDYEAKMVEFARESFAKFVKKLPLEGLSYEEAIELGSPAEEIARAAKEKKCEVILLGTHGYTGLQYRLLGSVATKVLRHAACHLLFQRPPRLNFSWLKKELEA